MEIELKKPLADLNLWLKNHYLDLELIVIGAFALRLHGISSRSTMDIDIIKRIQNELIIEEIKRIGDKYGLTDWLNAQADSMIMPDGYEERLLLNNDFSNIKLFYVARDDLIKLKVAAYYYRKDHETKDYQDLVSLSISKQELNGALKFLKEKHLPETTKFQKTFLKEIDELEKSLKEIINE